MSAFAHLSAFGGCLTVHFRHHIIRISRSQSSWPMSINNNIPMLLIFEGNNKELRVLKKKMKNQFCKVVLNTWNVYGDNMNVCLKIPNAVIWSSGHLRNCNLANRRNYFISKGIIHLKDLYYYENKSF